MISIELSTDIQNHNYASSLPTTKSLTYILVYMYIHIDTENFSATCNGKMSNALWMHSYMLNVATPIENVIEIFSYQISNVHLQNVVSIQEIVFNVHKWILLNVTWYWLWGYLDCMLISNSKNRYRSKYNINNSKF